MREPWLTLFVFLAGALAGWGVTCWVQEVRRFLRQKRTEREYTAMLDRLARERAEEREVAAAFQLGMKLHPFYHPVRSYASLGALLDASKTVRQ